MHSKMILPFFAKYLERELGVHQSEQNYHRLEYRLNEIATALSLPGIARLYDEAQKGISGHVKQLLLDSVANNEAFFADAAVFRAIERTVLPALAQKARPNEKLSFWAAACSTGQDALSLTMLVHEWQLRNSLRLPFEVTGTDMSDGALSRAKKARYSQLDAQRGLPACMMVKYFEKDAQEHWIAKPELKHFIDYRSIEWNESLNLGKKFDLVLCRNLLLCQNSAGQVEMLRQITESMNSGGYLVLGSDERILDLNQDYIAEATQGTVVYRRR